MKERKTYSVWVGGVEVNDALLTKAEAENLADGLLKNGYDDTQIVESES